MKIHFLNQYRVSRIYVLVMIHTCYPKYLPKNQIAPQGLPMPINSTRLSRRQLLLAAALISANRIISATDSFAALAETPPRQYKATIEVLRAANLAETAAQRHYQGYHDRAIADHYPGIALLFAAFALSEKIHAENYQKILRQLGCQPDYPVITPIVNDTKQNLIDAAAKEMIKIEETYPQFLINLREEGHDQTIISCMYSWRSHKQHQEKIEKIKRYSPLFFETVAERITDHTSEYYVCSICGSTISAPPTVPCEICNYPASYYLLIKAPA